MKTEIEQIRGLAAELLAKIGELENRPVLGSPTPKFEVGKWYWIKHINPKINCDTRGALINYQGNNGANQFHYGFSYIHKFTNSFGNSWQQIPESHVVVPATESEVKEALIKEGKRRQYDGNWIKLIAGAVGCTSEHKLSGGYYHYLAEYDELQYVLTKTNSRYTIYLKGQWAEIIQEEEITICGKEVVFGTGSTLGIISIDGQNYLKEDLIVLRKLMEKGQIKSLNVGCNGQEKVDLELLNKILNRMK